MVNMLKIIDKHVKYVSSYADYKLENGVLLFGEDWNGEIYGNGFDEEKEKITGFEYKPVYRFEVENIDISKIEENSDEWNFYTEIIGFEEY